MHSHIHSSSVQGFNHDYPGTDAKRFSSI